MIYEKRFANGLRLVVNKMEGMMSVSMGIIVGTGGAMETDAQDGISHFIEHMQFKGTEKRNAFEISDAFDRIGAQVNAFTGKDVTCYYSKSTIDHATEAFELLSDLFLNATYPEDEIVREKGVICEEIAMNEDTPEDLCLDQLATAFYGNENYGRNILGPVENVNSFTVEDVAAYKSAWYTPENIVVSFAGGVDFKTAETLVETYFGALKKGNFQPQKKKILLQRKSLVTNKPVEQMHVGIAYPTVSRWDKLSEAVRAVNGVLGGNMSSRLFQEVREKQGLAYSVYSYVSSYDEIGSLVVYAGVNASKLEQAYDSIGRVIDEIRKNGVTEDEFLRSREQMKSGMFFSNENTSSQMLLYGKHLLYTDTIFDFQEKLDELNALSLKDVNEALEGMFDEKEKAVSLVGNTEKPLSF
ncbi:MAG: insulinase family protein [Clostridia bacterium]|nr:insulinase family protein [Clostridia bacterium]